jgi:hypothetical protein
MMAPTPAESQNVVPLMSMIKTGAPMLAADRSAWLISPAFTASISAGVATTGLAGPLDRVAFGAIAATSLAAGAGT